MGPTSLLAADRYGDWMDAAAAAAAAAAADGDPAAAAAAAAAAIGSWMAVVFVVVAVGEFANLTVIGSADAGGMVPFRCLMAASASFLLS